MKVAPERALRKKVCDDEGILHDPVETVSEQRRRSSFAEARDRVERRMSSGGEYNEAKKWWVAKKTRGWKSRLKAQVSKYTAAPEEHAFSASEEIRFLDPHFTKNYTKVPTRKEIAYVESLLLALDPDSKLFRNSFSLSTYIGSAHIAFLIARAIFPLFLVAALGVLMARSKTTIFRSLISGMQPETIDITLSILSFFFIFDAITYLVFLSQMYFRKNQSWFFFLKSRLDKKRSERRDEEIYCSIKKLYVSFRRFSVLLSISLLAIGIPFLFYGLSRGHPAEAIILFLMCFVGAWAAPFFQFSHFFRIAVIHQMLEMDAIDFLRDFLSAEQDIPWQESVNEHKRLRAAMLAISKDFEGPFLCLAASGMSIAIALGAIAVTGESSTATLYYLIGFGGVTASSFFPVYLFIKQWTRITMLHERVIDRALDSKQERELSEYLARSKDRTGMRVFGSRIGRKFFSRILYALLTTGTFLLWRVYSIWSDLGD